MIEIMVVLIVISTLAVFALPKFIITLEKSRTAEGVQFLDSLLGAQRAYFTQNNNYATTMDQLDINVNKSTYFKAAPSDIVLQDNATALAQITRSDSSYSLTIDSDGKITCSSSTSGLCTKLGF